ncbi:Gfer: Sulfhydryl oxidase [Crotalus adamanteus]|uniref:Sulfhydryl oxidase n=1 Tax=Crotalus adamanteus TaxID=8729 RepID=A0AAW1AUG9_CROAD
MAAPSPSSGRAFPFPGSPSEHPANEEPPSEEKRPKKPPCRACTDFKSWMREQKKQAGPVRKWVAGLLGLSWKGRDLSRPLPSVAWQRIRKNQPDASNRRDLTQWFCRIHNEVNKKLGKPEFDCSLVDQRWRDGWKDGSCD